MRIKSKHLTLTTSLDIMFNVWSLFSTTMNDDVISFEEMIPPDLTSDDNFEFNLNMNKDPNRYKYSEDKILKELKDYISGTYNQHYSAGDDKIQTLDLIEACGDGESFCAATFSSMPLVMIRKTLPDVTHHEDPALCCSSNAFQRQER